MKPDVFYLQRMIGMTGDDGVGVQVQLMNVVCMWTADHRAGPNP